MKNIIYAIALVMGLGLSGLVAAAPAAFSGSTVVGPLDSGAAGGECAILGQNVTLSASASVHGAWQCDEVTGYVKVGACHEGGSRKGITCSWVDHDDDTNTIEVVNSQNCSGTQANAGDTAAVPAYSAFLASSAGGTMTAYEMDGRCTDTELEGVTGW